MLDETVRIHCHFNLHSLIPLDNSMINGTKLLNSASLTRGRRDHILRNEQVKYVVKVGSMDLRGIWIPFERALELAKNKNITDILYPLFVHNISALLFHPINQNEVHMWPCVQKVMNAPEQLLVKSNIASKIHRRSRLGCYICRLRRKKCDEDQSGCRACRCLGLQCEYKRPFWWNNSTLRKMHEEYLKTIIKRTKAFKQQGLSIHNTFVEDVS